MQDGRRSRRWAGPAIMMGIGTLELEVKTRMPRPRHARPGPAARPRRRAEGCTERGAHLAHRPGGCTTPAGGEGALNLNLKSGKPLADASRIGPWPAGPRNAGRARPSPLPQQFVM